MIPIRDTIQSKNYPIVNNVLIVANLLVFLVELAYYSQLNKLLFLYGLVPARYSIPEIASYFTFWEQAFAFISFMFLHGGFWHLIGNLWFLYIFGDNVEDRLGHFRYVIFYLFCGWVSGLTHLIFNWYSQLPTIGASGAIAGVMGAYLLLYPKARVLTLIPIFFIPYFIEVPAFFFIGLWIILQFMSAALMDTQVGGIAWWAHIGGFFSGMILLQLMLWLPRLGITQMISRVTIKKKTPYLHVIKNIQKGDNQGLYGTITITPQEARNGSRKIVSVPVDFRKKMFLLTIPPGIKNGTTLRLAGINQKLDAKTRSDVYIKTKIV